MIRFTYFYDYTLVELPSDVAFKYNCTARNWTEDDYGEMVDLDYYDDAFNCTRDTFLTHLVDYESRTCVDFDDIIVEDIEVTGD